MSDEKIREKPPVPQAQEKSKEPSAPKTGQSAFDKVMEQQKVLQQSPTLQSKVVETGSSEQRVRETSKWQERQEDRGKKDDREDNSARDKAKLKDKSDLTVTREAVGRAGEKKQFGQGSGSGQGKDKGGSGSDMMKRQIAEKKLLDVRGMIADLGKSQFAGKLAQARSSALHVEPQQMQAIVNKMVQSIAVGKNELGWQELRLILKDSVFAGLRLRFTSKNGKVTVVFDTKDSKVKALFTAESSKIKAALEEKGVVVESIKVG